VALPMLRFPRSILSLTSLGRAWQAFAVITTSTRRSRCDVRVSVSISGLPTKVVGREALILMALYSGYGEGMTLHGADALVVNISQTPGVVILEYEVQGKTVRSGKLYENRFISVVTIEDRKIVGWRATMIGAQASNDQLDKILFYFGIGKQDGAKKRKPRTFPELVGWLLLVVAVC
jgi:hypothetical protein